LGSKRLIIKNLDILAASNPQLLMPIKAKSFLFVSNRECKTFKGLWIDFYASPISSKRMQFYIFHFIFWFWLFIAFSNTCSTPFEVEDYDPWKYIIFIYGNCLQKALVEYYPLRLEFSILIANDFELPGFPIMRIGILFIKQTRDVNMFYIRAELKAIFY